MYAVYIVCIICCRTYHGCIFPHFFLFILSSDYGFTLALPVRRQHLAIIILSNKKRNLPIEPIKNLLINTHAHNCLTKTTHNKIASIHVLRHHHHFLFIIILKKTRFVHNKIAVSNSLTPRGPRAEAGQGRSRSPRAHRSEDCR